MIGVVSDHHRVELNEDESVHSALTSKVDPDGEQNLENGKHYDRFDTKALEWALKGAEQEAEAIESTLWNVLDMLEVVSLEWFVFLLDIE